ncbi:hypothetical protein GCM10010842_01220 [Deinococcus daejeonensis]|uniref:Uncharacterized protein n=1 Tax=Deinococcus daejeonensis TaxID=1007098 RepID=A0ABQ2ISH0_9DEIO|nr:hypothetical protein GCM10010842_01220 [Deinococcus daejeonensis]
MRPGAAGAGEGAADDMSRSIRLRPDRSVRTEWQVVQGCGRHAWGAAANNGAEQRGTIHAPAPHVSCHQPAGVVCLARFHGFQW